MNGSVIVQEANPSLALYDRMCTAIAECSRVDEAKDIRDKALALEAYYRQARNLDAEREAANVRLRAERRVGELLKELARTEPEDRNPAGRAGLETSSTDATKFQSISEQARSRGPSPYAAALADQGMSRQQASRYQALANIPAPVFEQALSGPEKATTAGMLKQAQGARAQVRDPAPKPRVSDAALWLWGTLRDFENDGYFTADPDRLLADMTDAMRADVLRLKPHVIAFLETLETERD